MSIKGLLSLIVAVVLVIAVFFFVNQGADKAQLVLARGIGLTAFTSGGISTGQAAVKVPFSHSSEKLQYINMAIDGDSNGSYDDSEWLIQNVPLYAQADWKNSLYFQSPFELTRDKAKLIVTSSAQALASVADLSSQEDKRENKVAAEVFESGDLFELDSVTNPEESMKGFVSLAWAQTGSQAASATVPDITQRPGECAPTAAANSLYSLANRNGGGSNLPSDPMDFIDQMKGPMNWSRANGVLPDDFVSGKTALANQFNLPIETKKVGDQHGASTFNDLQNALDQGGAAEMRIRFTQSGSARVIGGHMVTVTGARAVDGRQILDIHDPASPGGTDTIEVSGNKILGYGPWHGDTYLSWGFTQVWTGGDSFSAISGGGFQVDSADLDSDSVRDSDGARKVEVLVIGGNNYPKFQFHIGNDKNCGVPHWHASGEVHSIENTTATDPDEHACGFGKVGQVSEAMVWLPYEQGIQFFGQAFEDL